MQTIYISVLLLWLSDSVFVTLVNGSDRTASVVQYRIVNGKDAEIEHFPYQLSLRRNAVHICGASVLSSLWAITAAHCIDGFEKMPRMFTLRMGSNMRSYGGTVTSISYITKHPSYDAETMHCDVALLKTKANKLRGDFVSPIKLPRANDAIPENVDCVVSGWGHLSSSQLGLSPVLKYTTVRMVNQTECHDDMKQHGVITNAMFCAAARRTDACQGDSGGPIQINGTTLIGVVSWGVGCADPHYPGVYARLSFPPIRQWIKLVTKL